MTRTWCVRSLRTLSFLPRSSLHERQVPSSGDRGETTPVLVYLRTDRGVEWRYVGGFADPDGKGSQRTPLSFSTQRVKGGRAFLYLRHLEPDSLVVLRILYCPFSGPSVANTSRVAGRHPYPSDPQEPLGNPTSKRRLSSESFRWRQTLSTNTGEGTVPESP